MKKLIYTLLLLLVTFPAMAQSLFEQYVIVRMES